MIKRQYFEGFIEGLLWLFLSVFLGIKAIQLDVGTLTSPGAGFTPFIITLCMFSLSLILLLRMSPSQKEKPEQRLDIRMSAVCIFLSIFGYVLIFRTIGFLISTFLLMLFLFRFMGTKKWAWALGEALFVTLLCYLFFGMLLGLNFPAGIL